MKKNILHLDLDTFFVSCERLIDSRLQKRLLLVGGTGDRGGVAACSYETRVFGVHSVMAMKVARRLCPEAVVIRGNTSIYSKYSHLVTKIIKKKVPIFENQQVLIYGLLITIRPNKTSQNKLMRLSTFIDIEGNYFDAVHFTDVVHLYPINGIGIYGCYGKITNRYGFCSMNVIQSKKIRIQIDPRN